MYLVFELFSSCSHSEDHSNITPTWCSQADIRLSLHKVVFISNIMQILLQMKGKDMSITAMFCFSLCLVFCRSILSQLQTQKNSRIHSFKSLSSRTLCTLLDLWTTWRTELSYRLSAFSRVWPMQNWKRILYTQCHAQGSSCSHLIKFIAMQIANWAFDKLLPGGKLVFGNFGHDLSNSVSTGLASKVLRRPCNYSCSLAE